MTDKLENELEAFERMILKASKDPASIEKSGENYLCSRTSAARPTWVKCIEWMREDAN